MILFCIMHYVWALFLFFLENISTQHTIHQNIIYFINSDVFGSVSVIIIRLPGAERGTTIGNNNNSLLHFRFGSSVFPRPTAARWCFNFLRPQIRFISQRFFVATVDCDSGVLRYPISFDYYGWKSIICLIVHWFSAGRKLIECYSLLSIIIQQIIDRIISSKVAPHSRVGNCIKYLYILDIKS